MSPVGSAGIPSVSIGGNTEQTLDDPRKTVGADSIANTGMTIGYPNSLYDSANGTVSVGRVIRTNKGITGK